MRRRFTKAQRLRKAAEFGSVLKRGIKVVTPCLVLMGRIRENGDGQARLGIIITRKVGKAHVRNRFKRQIREIFRLRPQVPHDLEVVVIARHTATVASTAEIARCFESAMQQMRNRLKIS